MSGLEGKYGRITTEHKQFHQDEPIFLFRATDPLAPTAIRFYAHLADYAGCADEHIQAAFAHAERIAQWQRDHPELVKRRPD